MIHHTARLCKAERLDRLFYCEECGISFIFEADKEEHAELLGHIKFIIFTIDGKLLHDWRGSR
jgi:hypothetical protein